jgi:hypothetical protein
MSRSLDTTLAAALADANIQPVILANLTFKSGTVYVWSGVGSFTWSGNNYIGVGSLGNISAITEGSSVEAAGMTVTLSGIPLQPGTPVYVPATACPWNPSLAGNSTNYHFGYLPEPLPWGATAPVVVPLTLTQGELLTVTGFGSVTPNNNAAPDGPGDTAVGPNGGWVDADSYPGGPYNGGIWGDYASTCLSDPSASVIGAGGLMGAFTDAGGNVIQPLAIGTGATLTVPAGATQLQLGVNGNTYLYNAGAFTATVSIQSAVPLSSQLLSESLDDIQIGAAAQIYFGLFQNGALLGTPYLAFGGQVDQPNIKVSTDTVSISLALENRLSNLQRASQQRYTAASQQLTYPQDTAFNFVEQLNDEAWVWG